MTKIKWNEARNLTSEDGKWHMTIDKDDEGNDRYFMYSTEMRIGVFVSCIETALEEFIATIRTQIDNIEDNVDK